MNSQRKKEKHRTTVIAVNDDEISQRNNSLENVFFPDIFESLIIDKCA